MFKPSLEEFKQKAKSGNLIPVYKEIPADLESPVSAYMKIRGGEYSFLLESIEGGGKKWARYCFLGCDPSVVVSTKGRKVILIENGKSEQREIQSGSPLSVVKEILARYQPVAVDGLPRFSGGAVGFVSYDMVRFFEDLPEQTVDDLDVPDSQFVITDTMLVFDNHLETIKIVSNAFVEGDDLEAVYENTIQKISALEEKLKTPLPRITTPNEGNSTTPKFESNMKEEDHKKAVNRIKEYILAGDAIQVVFAQRLKIKISRDPFDIYQALRKVNPSPYMYYLNFGELQVVGSSPEVLVRLEDDKVEVRPIAGTRKRGKNQAEDLKLRDELLADEKEQAEHIMLVDLGRNDIGRVAEINSVDVIHMLCILFQMCVGY
jgi:anthranilate synthase component 1